MRTVKGEPQWGQSEAAAACCLGSSSQKKKKSQSNSVNSQILYDVYLSSKEEYHFFGRNELYQTQ